jgi:hypothetical protein
MKFNQVKTDEDTVITAHVECMFGDYPVLYQKWTWEGIDAESLIFCNGDIAAISLNELVDEVRKSPLVNCPEEEITHSVKDLYTFLNFNFKVN